MLFTLVCECGSEDFDFYDSTFFCNECGNEYSPEQAGKLLLADESTITEQELANRLVDRFEKMI